jgi:hypothetical protein
MSSFTTPLSLTFMDGKTWTVNQEFVYKIGGPESEFEIKVPAGFPTDFASIPRVFWRVLPPTGEYGKAAVVHDYLYSTQIGTREWSDKIFLEAMEVLGVPAWKRETMFRVVRMFGWKSWNNHAKKNKTSSTSDSA